MNHYTYFHRRNHPFPTSFQEIGNNIAVEAALKHIKTQCPDLAKSLSSIKAKLSKSADHGLDREEVAALYLCSAKSDNNMIHQMLNDALRSENTDLIGPWSLFLKLLYTGSKKLPSVGTTTVWRSMDVDMAKHLTEGEEFVWWTISSCCSSKRVLRRHSNEDFIPYSIEVTDGKMIPNFSGDTRETGETILLPGTRVRVKRSSFDSSKKTYDIHLIQVVHDESQSTDESSTKHESKLNSRRRRQLQRAGLSRIDSNGNTIEKKLIMEIQFNDSSHYKVHRTSGNQSSYTSILAKRDKIFQDDEADRQATGRGKQTWANGDEYIGEFSNGKKSGDGTLQCSNGYKYEGLWENDKMEGDGESTWPNGYRYMGKHSHGILGDNGTVISKNGETYEGALLDGKANGRGKRSWTNKDRYEGEFRNDKKHGKGTYNFSNGGRYLGDWFDDQMHGQGTLQWPSGNEYEGEFNKGRRHGQGKLTFTNGLVLEGKWEKDQFIDL